MTLTVKTSTLQDISSGNMDSYLRWILKVGDPDIIITSLLNEDNGLISVSRYILYLLYNELIPLNMLYGLEFVNDSQESMFKWFKSLILFHSGSDIQEFTIARKSSHSFTYLRDLIHHTYYNRENFYSSLSNLEDEINRISIDPLIIDATTYNLVDFIRINNEPAKIEENITLFQYILNYEFYDVIINATDVTDKYPTSTLNSCKSVYDIASTYKHIDKEQIRNDITTIMDTLRKHLIIE